MANEKDEQQLGTQDPKAELDQGKQQPTGQQDQPGETGQQGQASSGQADPGQSGGFIGSKATGSNEALQEDAATAESDFASQSQGALKDQDEDIETGQPSTRDNDIEGGSGA